jgi:hypothetical protein
MGVSMSSTTATAISWIDQINASGLMPMGLRIESLLMVAILFLLYVGFELIHNVELTQTKAYAEEKRRARLGRLTGG